MSFDPSQFKQQFPLFDQPENRELVYLDNAATTQRPAAVIEAISDFYRHSNANTHRSSHRLARQATEMVERCREKSAAFLNAASPQEIVFCRGATEALNLLAYSLTADLSEGDEIILSRAEHHANLVPWQMAAERLGLELRFLPGTNGRPDLTALTSLVNEKTRIVSITAGSNALGFELDIPFVAEQLSGSGIKLVVDAAQLAAHRTVDVEALGCDFLVCSAHKFYGPTGVGLLWGGKESLRQLPPWQGGGEMISSVTLAESHYAEPPHRFETGTSALAAIAGLEAALDWLAGLDRVAMENHEEALCERLHAGLARLPHIELLSSAESNLGMAVFVPTAEAGLSAADLAHMLDEQDIAVRVGHHCAMPLVDELGVGPTLRASLAAYNSFSDVEALLRAVEALTDPASSGELQRMVTDPEPESEQFADDLSDLKIDDLTNTRSWQSRYRLLLQWGDQINPKPGIRNAANRVTGCESEVWISHRGRDGLHFFAVDSESRVIRGLAALLLVLLNEKSSEELRAVKLEAVFTELGLQKHLSPSRVNGVRALIERIYQLTD